MDMQAIFCFARRQTKGAFHFFLSVPVRHTKLYLSVYLKTVIFLFPSVYLLVYLQGG